MRLCLGATKSSLNRKYMYVAGLKTWILQKAICNWNSKLQTCLVVLENFKSDAFTFLKKIFETRMFTRTYSVTRLLSAHVSCTCTIIIVSQAVNSKGQIISVHAMKLFKLNWVWGRQYMYNNDSVQVLVQVQATGRRYLHNMAIGHYSYDVCITYCTQSVCYDKDRSTCKYMMKHESTCLSMTQKVNSSHSWKTASAITMAN